MKPLIVLTIVSLALVACGKDDKRPGEQAAAASAAVAARPAPAPLPEAQDKAASGTSASEGASPAGRSARGVRSRAASAAAPSGTTHTVAKGDTLARIAKARGLEAADLARWNNVQDPRRLRVGQELRLTPP